MIDAQQLQAQGLLDPRAPRYASYPPVDRFSTDVGPRQHGAWLEALDPDAALSVYVHIPFCRRLCWFCACRTQVLREGAGVERYLDAVKREIDVVAAKLGRRQRCVSLHWGGGSPTILTPAQMGALAAALDAAFAPAPGRAMTVEFDPVEFDLDRIRALMAAGMTRAVIGVQDFDETVQAAIGRAQGFEQTGEAVAALRAEGLRDLTIEQVYGLAGQTVAGVERTTRRLLWLKPDRVALYGYVHAPWRSRRQVMIDETKLPKPAERALLHAAAAAVLEEEGYLPVGVDHYCLPGDPLLDAAAGGGLRRTLSGVTEVGADALIGLGASAVSRLPQGYAQNRTATADYLAAISHGALATGRGHAFSENDQWRAGVIEKLLCSFRFEIDEAAFPSRAAVNACADIAAAVAAKYGDLVEFTGGAFRILDAARPFARVIAREFDPYAG